MRQVDDAAKQICYFKELIVLMRVNFKQPRKLHKKEKKLKRLEKARGQQQKAAANAEMSGDLDTAQQLAAKGLSVAKRKQIFKKHRAKDVKAQIAELRVQSKKLNKKDLKQKA